MIIIKIMGGLGNQLFQYAFARSLSLDMDEELFLDLSFFNHGLSRHVIYGLHPFNIKGVVGNYPFFSIKSFNKFFKLLFNFKSTLLKIIPPTISIFNILEKNTEYNINYYFKELDLNDNLDFNYSFKDITPPSYFEGYFQFNIDLKKRLFITEKFFNKHIDIIHDDFTYFLPLTSESQSIADDMDKYDSILLHVRHGDYKGSLDFGLCSKEYYEKSVECMASKVNNPKFYIFSDDIEGAKKILNIDYPHMYVDFKENKELISRGNGELLKLMSSCKHFIIANSTISWWAAFLGENKDKVIITPTPWLQTRRVMGVETIDNLKPISIINNNKQEFDKSNNSLFKIDEDNFSFKNLEYELEENKFKIKGIHDDSSIILKNDVPSVKRFIIKISLESNCFNCFKIFFKTTDNNNYSNNNVFKIYYYDENIFEHYLIFPSNAILDELKIVPGHPYDNENDYMIIHSLEIKELNE